MKGKSISLTHNNLATILGVPRTNLQRYTTNDWVEFQGMTLWHQFAKCVAILPSNISISPKIPSSPLKAASFIISSPTTFFLGVAYMNTSPISTFSSFGAFLTRSNLILHFTLLGTWTHVSKRRMALFLMVSTSPSFLNILK